ncbi:MULTISPECIES: helix-turn-helix transcriptional regulator [unclassified Streptomyces]|uniref:helix-turn-helix transcriptional regulator n=1 Tax=unclassified Streptomyces TaxID=2593676 RepID=UPI000F4FE7B6|nr:MULTISPECIES: helix-turn-helix transcriptional regulator [unclassified Streptomyces]MDH6455327.1 transcriptional regulator with XRE-family HTH domain [Streptomyces sp. SAI-119]MDH6494120.1 transcriptional regulator with XRE-family HTH domain [Streptomyces sp. SAI-149]QUC58689.1 helix-turn-helix domain-containing protein [Streptomyces sp. A2-16]
MNEPAADGLGAFLRTRRARISPQDVGLPPSVGIRRVPGLRREEVALLAGVSAEYYERLERGRRKSASVSVLDAIARVLQLDAAERDHLHALASPQGSRRPRTASVRLRPGLRRALDSVTDVPALVLGPRHDLIAINDLGGAFYAGLDLLPPEQRNMVRYLFTVDAARDLYDDWEATARSVVAELRRYAGTHPHDPKLTDLVGDLAVRDRDFRRWWADHDVYRRDYGSKRYHHPLVGDLELGYEAMTPVGDPDLTFGTHTVEAHSPSAGALALLSSWSASSRHDSSADSANTAAADAATIDPGATA